MSKKEKQKKKGKNNDLIREKGKNHLGNI